MDNGIWRGSYERSSYFCCLIILLLSNLTVFGHNVNADQPMNASLIVLGRSGSGISSTVKQLIGPIKTLIRPEDRSNKQLEEFRIPLQSGGFLKIVDVDGLVDGKTLQADNQVLLSLKSYIQDPLEGLNNHYPNFFLIISTFDDSRFHGQHSVFIKTLKLVEMLQKDLKGNTTSNTAVLLTKLLTATEVVARRPQNKIQLFRQAISNFTSFLADHIEILVGENLPDEYDLKIENGYAKLPNKEFYPKNVFDKLIEVADRLGDRLGAESIMEFMNTGRSESAQIYSKFYPRDKTKANNQWGFFDRIHHSATGIKSTEIASALQDAYKYLNSSDLQSMTELQLFLQMNNFQNRSQLPTTSTEKSRFFQKLVISIPKLNLLKEAFDLEVPEYIHSLVVGHGFDVIKDESLLTSPLNLNLLKPSSIGYMIPDILNCSKLENAMQVDYTFYSEDFSNYTQVRFRSLKFKNKSTFLANGSFEGKLKSGFNIKPIQSDYVSLSATREIREIKCQLNNQTELDFNEEFINTTNELRSFDESNRDSVADWKGFFDVYGTHIVTLGFGGGSIQGSLGGQSLPEIINSTDKIHKSLKELVNFGEFSDTDSATYRFFGGYRDPQLKDILKLDSNSSKALLKNWQDSLMYDPTMLQYELNLIQISDLVKRFNNTLAEEIERNTQLILSGNLKYKRKSRRNNAHVPVVIDDIVPSSTSTVITPTTLTTRTKKSTLDRTFSSPVKTTTSAKNSDEDYEEEDSDLIDSQTTILPISKVKHKDYTENTVGQGFHALKGIILPKSPFVLRAAFNDKNYLEHRGTKYIYNFTMKEKMLIEEVKNPCEKRYFKLFNSIDEYLLDLFNSDYSATDSFTKNPIDFQGSIPSWVYITNGEEIPNFVNYTAETERRFLELKLDSTQIQLDKEFVKSAKALPRFDGTRSRCDVKQAYKNFFDTYGTHYIKSAFVGQTFSMTETEHAEIVKFLHSIQNNMECNIPPETDIWKPYSKDIYILKSVLSVERMGTLFYLNISMEAKTWIDKAYFHLVNGSCCSCIPGEIPTQSHDTFIHSACPQTLLNKFNHKQYPIGYGYHALKDVFLRASPFQMEKYEIDIDREANQGLPCSTQYFEEFDTRDDYIRARVNTLFPTSLTYGFNLSEIYEGDIPPWVFVKNNLARKQCWTRDIRFFKQIRKPKPKSKTGSLLTLTEDFRSYVEYLPDLETKSNCTIKIAWRNFFDTYGTHYVTSAFAGYSSLKNFTSSNDCTSPNECNTCVQFRIASQKDSTHGFILQRGMEFERLSNVFLSENSNYLLKFKIDEAYYHLLSGKLNFYCEVPSKADPCCEILNEMQ